MIDAVAAVIAFLIVGFALGVGFECGRLAVGRLVAVLARRPRAGA